MNGKGIGDRWCMKKVNYATFYNNKTEPRMYSENDDSIPEEIFKIAAAFKKKVKIKRDLF